MTDMVVTKNIGALVTNRVGSTSNSAVAAGSGDNTTKSGIAYDRVALGMARSAKASVFADATLTSGATLSVAITVSDSSDNSTFTDFATCAATTVLTATSAAQFSGQLSLDVDLGSAKRYVRLDHVPNLSAAGTDTALTRAAWTFAGEDRLPSVA